MRTEKDLAPLADAVLQKCARAGKSIATVESCTGGLISALLTSIPGSSGAFERGFVTYSNEAKHELVGVPEYLINEHGAVSEQVAKAMALGGLQNSNANIAVSVTGIAGPDGGTQDKPVGLVFIAVATDAVPRARLMVSKHIFSGANRDDIRNQSARAALELLMSTLFSD